MPSQLEVSRKTSLEVASRLLLGLGEGRGQRLTKEGTCQMPS